MIKRLPGVTMAWMILSHDMVLDIFICMMAVGINKKEKNYE